MGSRRVAEGAKDDLSKRPKNAGQKQRKQTGIKALDNAKTRQGDAFRAQRRMSDDVNAKASQHTIGVPVNKNEFNGLGGEQYQTSKMRGKKPVRDALKVIQIGGVGEIGIGKNCIALEYADEIVIFDMGFLFPPEADYPGINYICPDVSYLEARKDKIKAIVFTHGHLDHIGAVRHLLPKFPGVPVYGTKFTLGMVERQMEESTEDYEPNFIPLNPDTHERAKVGEYFDIELVRVNHSIPDAAAIVARTPDGVVVDTGDWRFEENPVDGKKFDLTRLTEIAAKEGIAVLLNESTNCESEGSHTHGEDTIKESIGQILDKWPNSRIIFSSFSSQIHRLQNAIIEAHNHGRKVAVAGYSMIQNLELAIKTGDIKIPKNTIVKIEDIVKLPDSQFMIICTGSQGEMNAVLMRMASGAHRHIKIKGDDVIVFSSNPIPGNEPGVVRVVDGLMREGSDTLQNRKTTQYGVGPLHLSGHGYYDDHVKLITALNPKFYIPIHGEYHMLVKNSEIARDACKIPTENIFVCDAGDVIEISKGKARRVARVQVGSIMYDQSGSTVTEVVLKDRIHMSQQGIFTVLVTVQRGSGRILSSPDIISRGFIYMRDSEELMHAIRDYVRQKITRTYKGKRVDMETLRKEMKDEISYLLYDKTGRTPIVIPVINEITTGSGSFQNDRPRPQQHEETPEIRTTKTPGAVTFEPRKKITQTERAAKFAAQAQKVGRVYKKDEPKKPVSFKKNLNGPRAGGWTE